MRGRDYVIPQDVASVYIRVVEHRLLLAPEAQAPESGAAAILKQILAKTPAPKV
jgi:MoxR-like ATPase